MSLEAEKRDERAGRHIEGALIAFKRLSNNNVPEGDWAAARRALPGNDC